VQDFAGTVALVTGGASGIGRACALLFAARGAAVVIGDLDERGASVAADIESDGGRAVFLSTDVTRQADCEAMAALALSRFGRLDFAANAAGITSGGGMFCAADIRDRTIAVNLLGVINSTCAAAAVLKQAHAGALSKGAIVNVASVAGLQGSANSPYYVASKHGVIGFSKSAALELAPCGIRVNVVCPGFTETPMSSGHFGANIGAIAAGHTPLGRIGTAAEQAESVIWLCSPAASFVSGAVLSVDGALAAGPKTYLQERA
jgi:NAD(P)-dependent dehydrogenase (short-subunit alcohol dehydrogenase family)